MLYRASKIFTSVWFCGKNVCLCNKISIPIPCWCSTIDYRRHVSTKDMKCQQFNTLCSHSDCTSTHNGRYYKYNPTSNTCNDPSNNSKNDHSSVQVLCCVLVLHCVLGGILNNESSSIPTDYLFKVCWSYGEAVWITYSIMQGIWGLVDNYPPRNYTYVAKTAG